jgi:hypothetical protein
VSDSNVERLQELLEYSQIDGRVCPHPKKWSELWKSLPGKHRVGHGWHPPLPLILAAWSEATDSQKRERFSVHLRYAAENGVIGEVAEYLRGLPPEDWYCTDEE